MIDLDLFKRLLSYNPETGIFTWTDAHKVSTIRGKPAGSLSVGSENKVYYELACRSGNKRQRVKAHRLAWYFVTGHMPTKSEEIDHIDGNGGNNKFENLRIVSKIQNSQNQRKRCDNKSGHCGVVWYKRDKTWQVEITVNRVPMFLGRYKSLEDAVKVRKDAELKYNFHPNHGAERPRYSIQELLSEARP